jgi:hypothetical protein
MDHSEKRLLRVFLSHSSGDKPAVRELHRRLRKDGFGPWLDEVDLIGGVLWEGAIEDTVRRSDVVVICLTPGSVTKEGVVQREMALALNVAEEKTEDKLSILPLKLEPCDRPRRLSKWHGIDYFKPDRYERLFDSLASWAKKVGAFVPPRPLEASAHVRAGKADTEYDKAGQAARFILDHTPVRPLLGLILGSGLGRYADEFVSATSIDDSEVPHFAMPASIGHAGRVVVGKRAGVPLVVRRANAGRSGVPRQDLDPDGREGFGDHGCCWPGERGDPGWQPGGDLGSHKSASWYGSSDSGHLCGHLLCRRRLDGTDGPRRRDGISAVAA